MATTSQELNINHTYAKESEDVGDEMEGLLVTGFLYNVLIDTINQLHTSSFQNKQREKRDYCKASSSVCSERRR